MTNPYSSLKDHQFWRRSVSTVEPHLFDPVVDPRFQIEPDSKVATAGSCFAQHISRRLQEINFNYFVSEDGAEFAAEERKRRNFGVFSARFGNIYTTAQLLQLFQECFGTRIPRETAWQRADGRFIDPYRQQVEPDGFQDTAAVAEDRAGHLAAVRRMFLECDVFIFTLGLTESWRSRIDGSIFPLAPGVVGSTFDPASYEFINFGVMDVYADLAEFLRLFREINPGAKVLLTVSPVPLIATYEDRSVLTSTVYSKSVLRVAAEMARAKHEWVDYFPSFEIITGNHAGGAYFESDLREVNRLGVSHVMRCFLRHLVKGMEAPPGAVPIAFEAETGGAQIICDEEMLDAVRQPI